jgi:glycosyltransferase involved in cell wall biosynthesis
MARTAIYVHRFISSNGVGNSAITFYEDLIKRDEPVDVYCMRCDPIYEKFSGIHKFPFTTPYSLEVLLLTLWSCITAFKYRVIHSFEVLTPNCHFFHVHFDLSIKKNVGLGWSFRKFARFVASKVTEIGLWIAIKERSVIVVPSDLLALNLRRNYSKYLLNVVVVANRLSDSDTSLIADIARDISTENGVSTLDLLLPKQRLGLIANGDFLYKGLAQIDELLEFIPDNYRLLIIGGNTPPLIESRYQGKVSWLPGMNHGDLFRLYPKLAGVLVASPFESFSMVALEAISSGLPVLFLGHAGICDFYKKFILQSDCENLMYTRESKQHWISSISREKFPQPEFNDYLVTLRMRALNELLPVGLE